MKIHRVCIITCPECSHQKTLFHLRKRCLESYTCKKCRHQCDPLENQRIFSFRGLFPANAQKKSENEHDKWLKTLEKSII
jgi:ribonuclease I